MNRLANNIAVAVILTSLNAAHALDVITRRQAALVALGEDTRNTPSWRDAIAEAGEFNRWVSMRTWYLRSQVAA